MNPSSVRWVFNFSKWSPSRSDILLASSCIQTEEKKRLSRFVFKKDLKSSLIGLLMLRKFVSEASAQPYGEIKFVRDEKGKPILETHHEGPKVNFNVSHHGNYTVCVGQIGDMMLGVDVMKLEYSGVKSLPEFFRIMTRQFSSHEWGDIKGAGGENEQIAMFCRHWSLKESYVKAIGVGITINLQEISFKTNTKSLSEFDVVSDTELYVEGKKVDWKFEEMLLDSDHCVAVAMDDVSCTGGVFVEITFDELMENCVSFVEADEQFCDDYFKKLEKP